MSARRSSPAGFMISAWSFCMIFALFCAFSGCAKTDTSNYVSESDIINQKVNAFGLEGTVVEIYAFHGGGVVVLENDKGDRVRAYASRTDTPVRGDRWTVTPEGKGYWPNLQERIRD